MTAAGMAGLLKLLGAFSARTRPATLHLTSGADHIGLLDSSPFRPIAESE